MVKLTLGQKKNIHQYAYLDALANFALALALNGNLRTRARSRAHHFKKICTRARAQFLNLHSRSALKSENIYEFVRGHF